MPGSGTAYAMSGYWHLHSSTVAEPSCENLENMPSAQELQQQASSAGAARQAAEADLARVKSKGADIHRKACTHAFSPCIIQAASPCSELAPSLAAIRTASNIAAWNLLCSLLNRRTWESAQRYPV